MHLDRGEAEFGKPGGRPTVRPERGLAHDESATHTEKRCTALGRGRWRSERSRNDEIETMTKLGLPAGCLSPGRDDRCATLEAEMDDRTLQECRTSSLRVEKDHADLGECDE